MASIISGLSNTNAKMRWKEPFITEGLNKKLNGIIPAGVVRGGRLSTSATPMYVTIQSDSITGDSVYSYVDSNGHQLTFRRTGNETLDLTSYASTTIYIVLHISYTSSVDTVVSWQAYSQAEVDADPNVIVLGRVDVPASGVIPAADITPERRRSAWITTSQDMREWSQVVKNGDFSLVFNQQITSTDKPYPHWDTMEVTETGGASSFEPDSSGPYVGEFSMKFGLAGAASQLGTLPHSSFVPVSAGQFVHCAFWCKGVSLNPGPGSGGHQGIRLRFWSNPGTLVSTEYVEDLTLTGSFSWTEIEKIIVVPTNCKLMDIALHYDDNNQSSTGEFHWDDVRVWVEQKAARDGEYLSRARQDSSVIARSLDISPPPGVSADLDAFIGKVLSIVASSVSQVDVVKRDYSSYVLNLDNGGLNVYSDINVDVGDVDIGKLITRLGRLRADSINSQEPRIEMYTTNAQQHFTCLLENYWTSLDKIRVYIGADNQNIHPYGPLLAVTINAKWQTNTDQWYADNSGDAIFIGFDLDDFNVYRIPSVAPASPWNHADWANYPGGYPQEHFTLEYGSGTLITRLANGVIDFSFAKTGAAGVAYTSNPFYSAYTMNTLGAKLVPKGWGKLVTSSSYPTIDDGQNIAYDIGGPHPHTYPASNIVEITLDQSLDSAQDTCVLVTMNVKGIATNYPEILIGFMNSVSALRIYAFADITGTAYTLSGNLCNLSYVIYSGVDRSTPT